MDNIFQIKDEFKTVIVGFNNNGLPLGERTDLDKLAEMAQYNPAIANLFVKVPTAEEILAYKENRVLAVTETAPVLVETPSVPESDQSEDEDK